MRTEREEYIDKVEKELKELTATITEFEERGSRTPAGTRDDFEEKMRDLKEKRDLLSSKLQGIRKSGDAAWTDLKAGVDAAKTELAAAFHAARDTFKKAA